jgi:hypothetical protein
VDGYEPLNSALIFLMVNMNNCVSLQPVLRQN